MGMRPLPDNHPVTQRFLDNFTQYNVGPSHGAVDIASPVGTPVLAPEDGIITFADWSWNLPGGANDWAIRKFQIKPPVGMTSGMGAGGGIQTWVENELGTTWVIAHLNDNNIAPKGTRVKKGQVIGYSGNTGSSTGPHTHIALIPKIANWGNGFFGGIDPMPYMKESYKILNPQDAEENKVTTDRALNGIDVSMYQPANIVSLVPSDFVIVKATEGVSWTSTRWKQQLEDARKRGKKVGVYHYAHPGHNSSDAEALHFYNTVKSHDKADLVWFLDWEEAAFYRYTAWASDFMSKLDSLTGKETGLYANTAGLIGGVWPARDKKRPLWRAYPMLKGTGYATSFNLPTPPSGWTRLVMDQYSFFGRLPGYNADLDLNVYYGGIPQWKAVGSAVTTQGTIDKSLEAFIMTTPERRLEQIVRNALDIHDKYKRESLGPVKKPVSLMDQVLWLPSDFKAIRDRQDRIEEKLDRLLAIEESKSQLGRIVDEQPDKEGK